MLVSVAGLNRHLTCALCTGYFREAHTIPECLHTFCKVCLFKKFRRVGKGLKACPTCQISLGPNAESKCVYDRNLQSCVDKLFPEFVVRGEEEDEEVAEEQQPKEQQESSSNGGNAPADDEAAMMEVDQSSSGGGAGFGASGGGAPGTHITVRVSPSSNAPESQKLPALRKTTLQARVGTRVSKVQAFILKRLAEQGVALESPDLVEILFDSAPLSPDADLTEAAAKWGLGEPGDPNPERHLLLSFRRRTPP